jgi:DNA-binding CsgD family transcriptional regulator/tetratricopeptide (TPR) repeat protein
VPRRQSSPEMIGRTDELGRLARALERAAAGRGGAAVVLGESGVGKTRLLTEFATSVRAGATILAGACLDLADGAPPYWAITDALRGLAVADRPAGPAIEHSLSPVPVTAGAPPAPRLVGPAGEGRPAAAVIDLTGLEALLPEPPSPLTAPRPAGTASGAWAQDQLFGQVLALIQGEAARRPVVLMIEDLHWADRSTRDLLTFLIAGCRNTRVLVVATYRSDALVPGHPLHPWLGEVLRSTDVELMELPRLTAEQVRRQLESILGGPARADVVEAVWRRSEGNAFFAEELLAAMMSGRDDLPPTLRQVLLARIGTLSPEATQVLAMVAIAGSPVRHELLAALRALPEPALLAALRDCVHHQVLLVDARGDGYAFRHSLLREAVLGQLLPAERVALHRASALALAERPELAHGPAATELAWHWAAAGEPEHAVPASLEAAAVAEASYAFAEACAHAERALGLWDRAPGATRCLDRLEVTLHAAELANASGDHERAAALARQAADLLATAGPLGPARAATVWERLGRYLWDAGRSEDALVAYTQAAKEVAAEPDGPVAARVLGAQAEALLLSGNYAESRTAAAEALDLARALGARREEVRILAVLGFDLAYLGHAGGVGLLHDARRIAEEDNDLDGIGRTFVHLATLLSEALNLLDEALTVADEGLDRVRALGLERSYGVALQALTVNVLFRLGRWPEADQRLQDAFDRNPGGRAAIDLRLARAKISLGRGDFAVTVTDLDAVKASSSRAVDPRFHAPVLTLEAGLALWEGRHEDARRAVAEGFARLSASRELWFAGPLAWHGVRAEADRAELARTRGGRGELRAVRATAAELLDRLRAITAGLDPGASAVHRAAALYRSMCEGEWSRLDGDSSPDIWAAAAADWDDMRQPYPAAYCRWRQAEALLSRQSRSAPATRALQAAHAVALKLGAEPMRREIEALARRALIKLSSPSEEAPPPAPTAARSAAGTGHRAEPPPGNAGRLSPREFEVLRLVARGHTNREIAQLLFISEKTAGAHISHILNKLEVRSRVEATAYAHRLGLLPPPE